LRRQAKTNTTTADYHTTTRSTAEGSRRDPKLTTMEATKVAQKPSETFISEPQKLHRRHCSKESYISAPHQQHRTKSHQKKKKRLSDPCQNVTPQRLSHQKLESKVVRRVKRHSSNHQP
jgi:hypothetical protein